jgi:uncharacterized damage-inducible protein DinB
VSVAQAFLPELDQEMATTRKVLERVPTEKGKWKPHPKSFPLGHLAQLVASMPGWITSAVLESELDLSGFSGYTYEKTESLLQTFDTHVAAARKAVAAASDADLMKPWSLRHGERVVFTLPRVAVVRQTINHLVHHRGQLTVYLRLLDVPVPSIYGPSADERVPGF